MEGLSRAAGRGGAGRRGGAEGRGREEGWGEGRGGASPRPPGAWASPRVFSVLRLGAEPQLLQRLRPGSGIGETSGVRTFQATHFPRCRVCSSTQGPFVGEQMTAHPRRAGAGAAACNQVARVRVELTVWWRRQVIGKGKCQRGPQAAPSSRNAVTAIQAIENFLVTIHRRQKDPGEINSNDI